MALGRIVLVSAVVLASMSPHLSEPAASRQKRRTPDSLEQVLPPRLMSLMPRARPLVGDSLASGVKSLSPPLPDQGQGIPDRQVAHVPFADVNHDGTRDVMELDLDMREGHPTYGFEGTLNLSTLDGSSGRVVGRYELPFHSGVPFVVPARVGPRGAPGAFIFLTRFISTAEAPTSHLEIYAVSGDGRELWTREWVSTSTSTIASRYVGATNVAIPMDLLEHRGRRTDVLVGIYDHVGPVLSMTPVAVSGSDGSSRAFDRVTVPWLEGTPWPVGAPDLDRHGGDDILTLETSGLGNGIMATSSESGEQLWHNESVATGRGTMVADVGDAVPDGTPDFALGAPLRLFDGATGDVVWKGKGGWYVVGHADVDGDRSRDILSAGAFFNERRFGADLYVVSSRGRRLGHTRYAAPRRTEGLSWVIAEEAGDLDRDRVPDTFLHLLHYGSSGEEVEKRSAISGRSSCLLAQGSDVFALGSSVGGDATADLLHAERIGASYRFTALDGVSGRTLWNRRVKVPRAMNLGFHPWAAGGSGRERDVAVSFFSPHAGRGLLLDGETGRAIWTRTLRP